MYLAKLVIPGKTSLLCYCEYLGVIWKGVLKWKTMWQ